MRTNVLNQNESSKIPAGIFTGVEVFAKNSILYALYQGQCFEFESLPSSMKRPFIDQFIADKEGQQFILKQFGITGFESTFKKWLFCKFGALDGEPDSIDWRITPDTYNSSCSQVNCPGRGKFCGSNSGLKGYQVATMQLIVAGKPMHEIANMLHLSMSAVKSRVEVLKESFAVTNITALAAKAADLGINNIGSVI